ncbi:PKD domain-containing protein [Xanthomarina sp.]|uniref:PKD domain-containing protein n=1 Tax=Xanthomarina sp. TaxID=1931211 RepID=UPI002C9D3FC3|nr:PKD domain-containing protein [Xanthomarina sp.]HLV40114.1 PKD domain-containing protein [Xanthomarina sp.]
MKHFLLTYIFVFLSFFSISSQTTKKVLFIGNSYTAANNLPSMVNNMAQSTTDVLIFESNTPGGFRFINHASNTTTLNKINSNDWDYVVLQAQSQETSFGQLQMETELHPFAESLSQTIRANNECSQPMFYMTWGRENGDASNCGSLPWVCNYEDMDDVIRATYLFMAETNDAEVAPAGAVWRYLRTNHPSINLYSGDGSHPSLAGSYAAATVFYTMIYKKDPTLITWNSSLSQTDANIIKMAAKTIVFDDMSTWDFTINPALADYSEVINAGDVSFTNTSAGFDTLLWDFGDGNTSTEINPVHTYADTGNYLVSLTVTKCGKWDTKTKTLNISNLSIEEFDLNGITVFPNPISNRLNIKLNRNYKDLSIEVFDIMGKSIIKRNAQNVESLNLDVTVLGRGMYILRIIADTHYYASKVIKN